MKKIISGIIILTLIITSSTMAFANETEIHKDTLIGASKIQNEKNIQEAIKDVSRQIYKALKEPTVSSIGGEWVIFGLARGEYLTDTLIPQSYYDTYYKNVEKYVKECKGVLHNRKYTEYSRVIVTLTAIGKNPRNVAGYDLIYPLGDYEKTIWQGINGPIWALIALDSGNYPMPENKEAAVKATRQMYVDRILECQLKDGGWSLYGEPVTEANTNTDDKTKTASPNTDSTSDPDITGMALQALAKYKEQPKVAAAIEEALYCMSKQQDKQGGFSSWGTANSESTAQMVVALCQLGISQEDARFVKNGNSMLDNLMSYYIKGKGFQHVKNGEINQMATEQSLYALVAVDRFSSGKANLYTMTDVKKENYIESDINIVTNNDDKTNSKGNTDKNNQLEIGEEPLGAGLATKHADVKALPVIEKGKTFDDIKGRKDKGISSADTDSLSHKNSQAIQALAERGIINGKAANIFDPDANMTRAEFATIVVKALGIEGRMKSQGDRLENELRLAAARIFNDVSSAKWYAPFIASAYSYEIITGKGNGNFDPEGTITRQEAAVMVSRAAKLCGLDTAMESTELRDTLAQFSDYTKVADWARNDLAFCYSGGILDDEDISILPQTPIKRCEIAEMLYQMLGKANLLLKP